MSFLLSLLIFFAVLSVIIVIHEFGHFIAARRCGVRVEVFSLGFGQKIIQKKFGDTEFQLCLVPFGGYVKLAGDNVDEFKKKPWEYLSQPVFKRAVIVSAGVFLNYIFAFLLFWMVLFMGVPQLSTKIGQILEDTPAQLAGVMIDDEVVRVDNTETKTWKELQQAIEPKAEELIELTVRREGELINIAVTPVVEEVDIFGEKKEVARIGIGPKGEAVIIKHGFIEAFGIGFKQLIFSTAMTYKYFYYMISGKISIKDAVAGPLRIYGITKDAANTGVTTVLSLMAVISMNLAIINFIPFPALDGGHVLFLVLEKIRGKPLNRKLEDNIHQVGLMFLFGLLILITANDFIRMGYLDKIIVLFSGN